MKTSFGSHQTCVDEALNKLVAIDFLKKLWDKDPSPWSDDPAADAIITHALGWLDFPQTVLHNVGELAQFVGSISGEFDHAVVLGMGGSSLAPDVLADTFGTVDGFPRLHVLDSTDPTQIAQLDAELDIARTLFIVASKSGTTTEPNAFFDYYYAKVAQHADAPKAGKQFIAITDPGTQMVDVAEKHQFRHIFKNDPDIGGRYSALSYFGMVPAAIAGYDVDNILESAMRAISENGAGANVRTAPGVVFGAAIGGLAKDGCDKLTVIAHPAVRAFGTWAEQLIAESTGKHGTGIIPIEGDALGDASEYGRDRVFVYVGDGLPDPDAEIERRLAALSADGFPVIALPMSELLDIGAQFYTWEIATAAAGSILGINAFDQPNVQESKDNTKALLATYAKSGSFDEPAPDADGTDFSVTFLSGTKSAGDVANVNDALAAIFSQLVPGDYVAICAYIARDADHTHTLDRLRGAIRDATDVAVTVGFGPRFLHSTGQLHKGGPNSAVMLQIVGNEPTDPPIPTMNVGFRTLLAAQALGDWQSLDKRHRRGGRITLKGDIDAALAAFLTAVDAALSARA